MSESADKTKSDRILDEAKKRQAQEETVQVEEKKVKLVVFTLLDNYFAFYGQDAREILPVLKVYFVPGSPDYILGIINVRGDIQSVLDIKNFMQLPASESRDENRIIIAEQKDVRSGILVDSVEDVLDVPESSIKGTIGTLDDSVGYYVVGETTYKGHNVTLLNVGKLFEKIAEK